MYILGIESTAHTFGVGITDGKKILANSRHIYSPKSGGIVPPEAAAHHRKVAPSVLADALIDAGIGLKEISKVAVAIGPGLPPCLLAGLEFSRGLKKPLLGVNHCIAHIEIGKFDTKAKDPLTVYVSGGNTQIIGYDKGYRVFGETLDIGLGNALDKFGRSLGLASPSGPQIEILAGRGKRYIELPYTVKGMDLTFSGLVTAASKRKEAREDVCYSFQETAFAMLTEVSERALAHTGKKELLLTGGVAQNRRLQKMLREMTRPHKAKFYVPRKEYCGDNGAMIAIASLRKPVSKKLDIRPRWRTDEI